MVDQELKVSDNLVPCNNPPSDNSAQSNGSLAPCRTTKIRFLDQLSPEAQQAYHDEQERKKEEKKSKIEEIGESETRIETVEQPSAAALASQTAENTQYNRLHQQEEGGDGGDGVRHNSSNTVSSCQAPVSDTSTSSHAQHNQVHENNLPTIVGIQTRYSEQVSHQSIYSSFYICHSFIIAMSNFFSIISESFKYLVTYVLINKIFPYLSSAAFRS